MIEYEIGADNCNLNHLLSTTDIMIYQPPLFLLLTLGQRVCAWEEEDIELNKERSSFQHIHWQIIIVLFVRPF